MATPASPALPASAIPRPGYVELATNLLTMGGGRVDMLTPLRRMHGRYGDVVLQQLGSFRSVNLFGPEANRTVLLDRERIFSARKPWDMIMGRIFSNGLLLRDGDDHKHHRKIMHTAFTRPALRSYADRMNPTIEGALADWGREAGPFLAFRAYKALTLDMAASIFVGVDLGPATARMNQAFEDMVAASMSRVRLRLPGLEFYRGLVGREWLVRTFRELLPKKRASDGLDMFTRLCQAETEDGRRLADAEIVDHMVFLMMAAHDTTTSALSSILYELGRHPEWQERCRAEADAIASPTPTLDDLERMPLTQAVFREALRRYPPLPVFPKMSNEAFEFGGYRIPADILVVIHPILTHHLPEYWREPMRFDPERFLEPRSEHKQHPFRWVPFSAGAHLCMGMHFAEMQVKAVLLALLRRHRWSLRPGYRMPFTRIPISKPTDGLPLIVEPRAGRERSPRSPAPRPDSRLS